MARSGFTSPLLCLLLLAGCSCEDGPGTGVDPDPNGNGNGEENRPPVVTILSPADASVHLLPDFVVLVGEALDPEDGRLGPESLAWSSSLDGELGIGDEIVIFLSAGEHRIQLEAVDSQGRSAQDSISLTVREPENLRPQVVIEAPAEGSEFVEGESIAFIGSAIDPEEGELGGASLTWTTTAVGVLGTGRTVTWSEPPIGSHRVVLTAVDREGLTGQALVHVEIVPVGENRRPTVTILQPQDGAGFVEGEAIHFEGEAVDPEEGELTGDALVWESDRQGEIGRGRSIGRADLFLGVHDISLTATDSEGGWRTALITITVNAPGDDPPVVTIFSPANGAIFESGASIVLHGQAEDPEDGMLLDDALSWSSSRDGFLGTGAHLERVLSGGLHAVRLTATDSGGNVSVARVDIEVLPPNQPPAVSIISPTDGESFEAGTTIDFVGQALDPEDGGLGGSSLTWRSNLDGVMGTGASLAYAALSVGSHQISLTAIDGDGAAGSARIDLVIEEAPAPLPPVARLTGPSLTRVGDLVTFDGSESSSTNGSIVSFRFDFGDGTAPVLGSSSQAENAFSSIGDFSVTLTVTDQLGLTGQAVHGVRAIQPGQVPELVASFDSIALGSACDIATGPGEQVHVVFHESTHPSIWYARWDGAWQVELIEGMGFNVGGRVRGPLAITAAADGTPHIAYEIDDRIHYATLDGNGGWIIERVDGSPWGALTGFHVAIALDPANGNRPTVTYARDSAYRGVALGWRTGPGAWTSSAIQLQNWTVPVGGLLFDSSGTAHLTANYTSGYHLTWTESGGFLSSVYRNNSASGHASSRAQIVLDSLEEPIILDHLGVWSRPAGTWSLSAVEESPIRHLAAAASRTGVPIFAWFHEGELEISWADPRGYWERAYTGPMDAADIGLAVDDAGRARACFFRSGRLIVY